MSTLGIKKIFRTPLNVVSTTDIEGVGTLRFEGASVYKWVKFTGTTAVAIGDVVCYVAYATDATGTVTDAANTNLGAGVAMCANPISTVGYGWIQVKGVSGTLSTALGGSPALGVPVTTNGASAKAVAAVSTTAATLATQQVVGWSYDSTGKQILCNFPF